MQFILLAACWAQSVTMEYARFYDKRKQISKSNVISKSDGQPCPAPMYVAWVRLQLGLITLTEKLRPLTPEYAPMLLGAWNRPADSEKKTYCKMLTILSILWVPYICFRFSFAQLMGPATIPVNREI